MIVFFTVPTMLHKMSIKPAAKRSFEEGTDLYRKHTAIVAAAAARVMDLVMPLVISETIEYVALCGVRRIKSEWSAWETARHEFWREYAQCGLPPNLKFPQPPDQMLGGPGCWRMWALLIQHQVEGHHDGFYSYQTQNIKDCVAQILKDETHKKHPASCPCKVPNNPWDCSEQVEALEPLDIEHHERCRCAPGPEQCHQKNARQKIDDLHTEWNLFIEPRRREMARNPSFTPQLPEKIQLLFPVEIVDEIHSYVPLVLVKQDDTRRSLFPHQEEELRAKRKQWWQEKMGPESTPQRRCVDDCIIQRDCVCEKWAGLILTEDGGTRLNTEGRRPSSTKFHRCTVCRVLYRRNLVSHLQYACEKLGRCEKHGGW